MRGAPVPPQEYAEVGEPVLDDAALKELGYAYGLGVWEQMGKAYEWYLSHNADAPSGLDNAQMWSLREAIRQELRDEIAAEAGR